MDLVEELLSLNDKEMLNRGEELFETTEKMEAEKKRKKSRKKKF